MHRRWNSFFHLVICAKVATRIASRRTMMRASPYQLSSLDGWTVDHSKEGGFWCRIRPLPSSSSYTAAAVLLVRWIRTGTAPPGDARRRGLWMQPPLAWPKPPSLPDPGALGLVLAGPGRPRPRPCWIRPPVTPSSPDPVASGLILAGSRCRPRWIQPPKASSSPDPAAPSLVLARSSRPKPSPRRI